jgi:hypothetical protein
MDVFGPVGDKNGATQTAPAPKATQEKAEQSSTKRRGAVSAKHLIKSGDCQVSWS